MKFFHLNFCKPVVQVLLFISSFQALGQGGQETDIVENSLSAVVTVAVFETDAAKKTLGFRGNPADMAYAKMLDLTGASGSGSGFFIRYNGKPYIITNAHVVEQASDAGGSIYVYTINRNKYRAKIRGGDSFYDLAVLEPEQAPGAEVSYLDIRGDIPARIGERVYAIGNPLGEYPYSVSEGIISARNRVRGGLTGKFGFLQTTATVIWGNSGGPLIDRQGKVVGVNSQIAFASQGETQIWQPQINFALEAGIVSRLIADIINNNGLVSRVYLGAEFSQKTIAWQPGTKEYQYYSRTLSSDAYPVLTKVADPSSALAAYTGYQVTAVNGEPTRNPEEVLGELEKVRPGATITFTLKKGPEEKVVLLPSVALKGTGSAAIGRMFMGMAGLTFTEERNKLYVRPAAAGQADGGIREFTTSVQSGKAVAAILPGSEYEVLGIGLLDTGYESLWRVNSIADAGTAIRLTGLSGVVDLVLFRKGADPERDNSYVKKRLILSGTDNLIKKTLWY